MNRTGQVLLTLLGLGLLSALCVGRHAVPPPAPLAGTRVSPPRPVRPATPFERSLQRAWTLRTRARLAENREREALESWDPTATAGVATEDLRRADLARDPSGNLRHARASARQAAALALTPMQEYRAAWLLGRIDCDLGDHDAELEQARRLMLLAPRNRRSLEALRHAEGCLDPAGRDGSVSGLAGKRRRDHRDGIVIGEEGYFHHFGTADR